MKISDAGLGGGTDRSTYIGCSFDRSKIRWFDPGLARFERCSFRDVVVNELFSQTAEFVGCFFSGRIKKGLFWGSNPEREPQHSSGRANEFRGNDFRDAILEDVGFRGGIDLSKQVLPQSANHVLIWEGEDALRATRAIVTAWKDLDARRRAMPILAALDIELKGQEQLFIRPDIFYGTRKRDADVTRAVFDLLAQNDRPPPRS
jgi:hypothetical protein